ncbi:MAG: hypothetical protein ACI9YL_000863 [Luteibaculaceae bacterium]|jgi:hypothetical protein
MNKSIILCLGITCLAACIKEDSTEDLTPSVPKKELLAGESSKVWVVDKIIDNGIDITSTIQPCRQDDNLQFFTNTSFKNDEGTTKCANSDPQTIEQGTWRFSANETELSMYSAADPVVVNILKLSATEFDYTKTINGQVIQVEHILN